MSNERVIQLEAGDRVIVEEPSGEVVSLDVFMVGKYEYMLFRPGSFNRWSDVRIEGNRRSTVNVSDLEDAIAIKPGQRYYVESGFWGGESVA